MSLRQKLNDDLKKSMKAGDTNRTGVLRMLSASLKNKEIEMKGEELKDDDVMQVINKEAKKRKEAIEAFTKGGRTEIADKEKAELVVLETYLPKQLSKEEVVVEVEKVLEKIEDKSNIGLVMKDVMSQLKGKADGKTISEVVKEKLAK